MENTHLWLFRNIIRDLKDERPELFSAELVAEYKQLMIEGVQQECEWGEYVIGNNIQGLSSKVITDYIRYLGNLRWRDLGWEYLYKDNREEPEETKWVSQYSNPNMSKTDFFEGRSTAYAKSTAVVDDL